MANEDALKWKGPIKPPSLDELADRYALGQLARTYALGVDMRDYAITRSVFADDAICAGSSASGPVDEYLPTSHYGASHWPATQHNITNQHIRVDGDTALVWSFAIAHHMWEPERSDENLILGVIYKDQCRRFPEGWLITRRDVELRWREGEFPKVNTALNR